MRRCGLRASAFPSFAVNPKEFYTSRMIRLLLALGLLMTCAASRSAVHHKKHNALATIRLNGERTDVNWTDGDSFKVREGQFKGLGTRLQGYNTLEAFGPVHRWGKWTPQELFELAEDGAAHAAMEEWECTTDGTLEGYGRLLVSCPKLTEHMIGDGYAMAYSVDGPVPAPLQALQQKAIAAQVGMWRKGAPKFLITSLHSADEPDSKDGVTYNRVVDTRTGVASKREHQRRYSTCEEVCESIEGQIDSCMTYVPFQQRYKRRPDCLR